MDYHAAKAKTYSYIASFDIVLTVSFSSKCNISVLEILVYVELMIENQE